MSAPSRFSPQDWEATLVACHYHPKHKAELMKLRDDMHDYEMHVHRLATDPNHKVPDPPNVTTRMGQILGDSVAQFSRDESPLDLACRLSGIDPADVVASLPSEFSRQLDEIGPVEFSFDESKHPRGQPGNAGQFAVATHGFVPLSELYKFGHLSEEVPSLHPQDIAGSPILLSSSGDLLDGYHRVGGMLRWAVENGHKYSDVNIPVIHVHDDDLAGNVGDAENPSRQSAAIDAANSAADAHRDSPPVENTPFIDISRHGSTWGGHEYEFNGNDFSRIPIGTHGWTQAERDALEFSGMSVNELKETIESGPDGKYWDSIEQLQEMFPDELSAIIGKLKKQE